MDNQKRILILGSVSLAFFLILALIVKLDMTRGFDVVINHAYTSIDNYVLTILSLATLYSFKTLPVAIITVIICGYLYYKKKKTESYMLATGMILDVVLVSFFKYFIGRERPLFNLWPADGFSFPSGHATVAMVFLALIATMLYPHYKVRDRYKIGIISGIIIAWIGFTRIYLGAHYFTDVFGGFLLGTAIACFTIWFYKKSDWFFSMYERKK